MTAALLERRIADLRAQGMQRVLSTAKGIDLSSNDYLGFAEDEALKSRFIKRIKSLPNGSSGSRLLGGNLAVHEETEEILADFVNRESALLFSSGYQANLALLSALLHPDDLVFSDQFNHASIIDGIRLSKAKKIIYPHLNLQILESYLQNFTTNGLKLIVTESLFSMEGTLADLTGLAKLATQYNALLIVDEAHSTGIWGSSLVATLGLTDQVFATVHTAGKALGVGGAWIAGDLSLKNYLINFARPCLFSTAPLPTLAIALQEAIMFYQNIGRDRAETVLKRAEKLRDLLPCNFLPTEQGPIVPIRLGENFVALKISEQLQQRDWDIRAIRPPTVPVGTARLRVTVKWNNSDVELKQFASDLTVMWREGVG